MQAAAACFVIAASIRALGQGGKERKQGGAAAAVAMAAARARQEAKPLHTHTPGKCKSKKPCSGFLTSLSGIAFIAS